MTWRSPLSGATLSGTINGSTCAVDATSTVGMDVVSFWIDNYQIQNDYSAPFNCAFDTKMLSDGPHTMMVQAYNTRRELTTSSIPVTINNTATTTAPAPAPVTTTPPPGPVTTIPSGTAVATPAPTAGSLGIWFKAPANGATVSGTLNLGSNCYVKGTGSIARVDFFLDATSVGTDSNAADGMQCLVDTTKFANGTHQLKAVAVGAGGSTDTDIISINIQNAAVNKAPTVAFVSPAASQTVSGTLAYSANAADDSGVTKVDFSVDSTALGSKTAAPWSGSLDTTKLANGTHVLNAIAYDAQGLTATSQVSVNVQNVVAGAGPTPAPTAGSLGIWFKAPANGATVSGTLNLGSNCYVKGTGSIARVDFFLDATSVGTDSNVADGMQCLVDTTKFANGAHQLKAVAVGAGGSTDTDIISINIQNAATTPPVVVPPAGTNQAPTVSFASPTASQTVSGTVAYSASAADDKAVTKVVFMADTTTLATKTAAPWSGSLDTKTLPNGSHKLIAIAYDAEGLSTTAQVAVNVNNTATSSLPAGGKAVPTFHSIGLYWTPKSNPGAAGCSVQYKKSSDSAWKPGLNMWYDARNSECRGSLVMLDPGQSYDVQMGTGSTYAVQTSAQTWSEQFPIAKTVTLPAGTVTQPLAITQGGAAGGYVLYQANPAGTTIDVQNAYPNNVTISAPYVILRGVTLKGGQINGVELKQGAHDVVIEGNDISNWGRFSNTSGTAWNGFAGWDIGVDMDAGIRASCTDLSLERVVIQRNKIHDPRYGANSWDWGHPSGPQGITFSFCGGNNVFRYNEITSSDYKHFFNDGIGGEDNFTQAGFPNYDSDIYGNIIRGAMDDGLEIEGGDKNVRVWGNYLDQTGTGIATTVAAWGPVYIFRNVYDRSRMKYITAPDLNDDRGPFFKSGTQDSTIGNGRRYVFHNTSLQAAGASFGLGAGGGLQGTSQPLTNTVSRNNIFNIWKSNWPSMDQGGSGYGNDFNNDLYNGSMNAGTGAEASGAKGTPTYQSGSGVGMSGMYQLAPSSLGYGKGAPIPNFNDAYGSPDMGAHQSGTPAMKFGVNQ